MLTRNTLWQKLREPCDGLGCVRSWKTSWLLTRSNPTWYVERWHSMASHQKDTNHLTDSSTFFYEGGRVDDAGRWSAEWRPHKWRDSDWDRAWWWRIRISMRSDAAEQFAPFYYRQRKGKKALERPKWTMSKGENSDRNWLLVGKGEKTR